MTGIARAAANAEDEQPSTALADGSEFVRTFFNRVRVELRGDLLDFRQKFFCKAHVGFDCNSVSNSAKPAGEPIS